MFYKSFDARILNYHSCDTESAIRLNLLTLSLLQERTAGQITNMLENLISSYFILFIYLFYLHLFIHGKKIIRSIILIYYRL